MSVGSDLIPYIYHETQEADSMLCAQHALNNLLQQPLYSAFDLAGLGKQLDDLERSHLSPADQSSAGENYDDSGFFSLAVMENALSVMGLRLVRWASEDLKQVHDTPEAMPAFIMNQQQHWYAIRSFGNQERFYNVDSCIPHPTYISPLYLSLFLQSTEQKGYSIFAVLPLSPDAPIQLPPCKAADVALDLPLPSALNGHVGYSDPWSQAGGGNRLVNERGESNFGPSSTSSGGGGGGGNSKKRQSDEEFDSASSSDGGGVAERVFRRRKTEHDSNLSEEEQMARAMAESLRVSGGGGGGGSVASVSSGTSGTSAGFFHVPPGGGESDSEVEIVEETKASKAEEEEVDEPSIEELRRRRLKAFEQRMR